MNCPYCGMPEAFRHENESVWHKCGSVTVLDGGESLRHDACRHITSQNAIIAAQSERVRVLEEALSFAQKNCHLSTHELVSHLNALTGGKGVR